MVMGILCIDVNDAMQNKLDVTTMFSEEEERKMVWLYISTSQSQHEVSRCFGCSQGTVSRVVRGYKEIATVELEKSILKQFEEHETEESIDKRYQDGEGLPGDRYGYEYDGYCEACMFQSPDGTYEQTGDRIADVEFPETVTDDKSGVSEDSDEQATELSDEAIAAVAWSLRGQEEDEIARQYGTGSDSKRSIESEHREMVVEALLEDEEMLSDQIGKSTLYDPNDRNVQLSWLRAALDELDYEDNDDEFDELVTDGGQEVYTSSDGDIPSTTAINRYGRGYQTDETRIETVKIGWRGYARGRITEYQGQYEVDGWRDAKHGYRPDRFLRVGTRQKTQLVIHSLEEADAIYYGLGNYHSNGRTWMNSAMDRSVGRVRREIREAMEKRGFEPEFDRSGTLPRFLGFKPISVESDDQEITTDGGTDIPRRETEDFDHTPLDEPIKVRFVGEMRDYISEFIRDETASHNNSGYCEASVSVYRAFSRQKTNVVVETVEEAKHLIDELSYYSDNTGGWWTISQSDAVKRVIAAIEEELESSGSESDTEDELMTDGGEEPPRKEAFMQIRDALQDWECHEMAEMVDVWGREVDGDIDLQIAKEALEERIEDLERRERESEISSNVERILYCKAAKLWIEWKQERNLMTDGGCEIIYEVHSEQDGGPITEYRDRDDAEERAEELDGEFPYQDHYVEEKKIYFDGGYVVEDDEVVNEEGQRMVILTSFKNGRKVFHDIDISRFEQEGEFEATCDSTPYVRDWKAYTEEYLRKHGWRRCGRCSTDCNTGATGGTMAKLLSDMDPEEFDEKAGLDSSATRIWKENNG